LNLLRCPAGGGQLKIAEPAIIDQLNHLIGQPDCPLRDRQDQRVETPLDGGLIDASGQWLYPIRAGIPTLIADQAIPIPTD
jgi:uncharacterized protein YbaR (Trm112 family)